MEVKIYPPITLRDEDDFEETLRKLCAEGWSINSSEYMQADTPEEAVKIQAKTFDCLEFQPVKLPHSQRQPSYHNTGRWVAFHRAPKPKFSIGQQVKIAHVDTIYTVKDLQTRIGTTKHLEWFYTLTDGKEELKDTIEYWMKEIPKADKYGDWTVYYDVSQKYWFLQNIKGEEHPHHFDHSPTLQELETIINSSEKKMSESLPTEAKPELLLNQVDWKTIFETMPEWNKESTPTRNEIFNLLIKEGRKTKQLASFLLRNEYAKKVCEQIYLSFLHNT